MLVPAKVVTVAGANTTDLRPAKEVTRLWVSLRHILALLSTQNRKYNKVQDLFIETNRDVSFLVRHIVRISFVCVHLCPPIRMGVYGAYYLFIYLFIYLLFFY